MADPDQTHVAPAAATSGMSPAGYLDPPPWWSAPLADQHSLLPTQRTDVRTRCARMIPSQAYPSVIAALIHQFMMVDVANAAHNTDEQTGPAQFSTPSAPAKLDPTQDIDCRTKSQTAVQPKPTRTSWRSIHAGLPLPAPIASMDLDACRHVVTTVDRDGRLADRSIVTFLNWSAGQQVTLTSEHDMIIVARAGRAGRAVRISPDGRLRLPLKLRRCCGVAAGDRVLAATSLPKGEILVIPVPLMDAMIRTLREWCDAEIQDRPR